MIAPRRHVDLDAEASILGGIFLRNEVISRVHDLELEDFYDPKHQSVFAAMRNIETDGVDAIDQVTVSAELQRLGRLEALGGMAFLLELMLRVPTPDNVEHYARIVKKHRATRELRLACADVIERIERGGDEDAEGDPAVQWAISRLMRIRSRSHDPGRLMGDLITGELDQMDADLAAIERGERVSTGMPTGIRKLDDGIGGTPIGNVTLVMGGTGHGKSTLLGAMSRAAALDGDFAFVYSHEDSLRFWAQRGVAQESGVPTEAIARRRHLDHALQMRAPGEFAHRRLQRARADAWRRREVIIPASGWSVEDIIADVRSRRARMQSQLGGRKRRLGVYVDYIQVVRMLYPRGVESRTQAIELAMDRFQFLAAGAGNEKEDCSVVLSSQVKPAVDIERRPPRKEDWVDSFATVKVSKLVLGINRPSKYDKDANPLLGKLEVLKRNQGDDEVHADVVLDLAIHTIRDVNDAAAVPAQQQIGGIA